MIVCHVNLATGFSGGERQTLLLIEQQLKQGERPLVVANPASAFYRQAAGLGCPVFAVSHFVFGHLALKSMPLDIMHVHEGRAVYWALIHHLLTRKPYLITRRIDNPLKKKYLLNLAYRKAKHLVGLSTAIKGAIERTLPDMNVKVIPSSPVCYPINPTQVKQIKSRHKDNAFLVVQAGKMLWHKGYDVTIECARILQETHKHIRFCLLGDGPEAQVFKAQAKGLTNLTFEGEQSNMGDWFAAADVLIHPSHNEGLGSVILEAIQAGLPVIGARAGGIPDIIQDLSNGLLINPGDPNALADAIVSLSQEQSLIDKIRQTAPATLKKFDIATCAARYHSLYVS